jgi:hypothetical protein
MLYHHKLGFPTNLPLPIGQFKLVYTHHARSKGLPYYPPSFSTFEARVIEIEVNLQGEIRKILYRMPYQGHLDKDILLAITHENGKAIVRTVYLNDRSDNHATLNTVRYTRP